jgi:PAS domain S-box-containing protein
MNRPLQVLVVEDVENDAKLLEIELQRAGYDPACHRVETPAGMIAELERQSWDVVIADYALPHFNGLAALSVVKERNLDVPFIIVSGQITDDMAVAAMKAGAHDYVMKDNLARLGSAVERELREAVVRRERRRSEEKLQAEHTFRQAIEKSVPAGIATVDLDGRQTYVNPAFCDLVGWTEDQLIGAHPPFVYWPPEQVDSITGALARVVHGEVPPAGQEVRFRRRNGERIDVLLQVTPLKDAYGNITGWVSSVSNITERKRAEARLTAEHAITRVLAHSQSLAEAAPEIVKILLEGIEADLGALWVLEPRENGLRPAVIESRTPEPRLESFLTESRRLCLGTGGSLPGRVWQERQPVWLDELSREENLLRRDLAVRVGFQSAAAFPIQNAGDFLGVLEFFAVRRMPHDLTLAHMMNAIGSEIGQFIQRRAAEDALRRAHDELELRVQQRTADLKTANTQLEAAIVERQRLEQELLDITEKERRRIGLDLHDDLGQKLSGIALMTKGLELRLAKDQTHALLAQDAARIHGLVQQAMNHASDLAHDLATLDLKEGDLAAALNELAAHARDLFEIPCRFKAEGHIPPLDINVIRQLYKIAQEAVTNAIKHGKAKRVEISLADGSDHLILTVQNSGLPFPDLKSHSTGMGLRIMNYRASLIGATLDIRATGSRGTLVTCSVPLVNDGRAWRVGSVKRGACGV